MARSRPRPRRSISPRHLWMLRLLGFRYSAGRDAYVLHVVGNRFGPVFKPTAPEPASTDEATSNPPTTRTA
jgi:hypothetical protein